MAVSMWSDVESMAREELDALQLTRLKTLLARLGNVPFYQNAFKASRIAAGKIENLADLKYLPFTTKKDLRDQYPLGFLAAEKKELVRFHASSGTRGKPTLVAYTAADLEVWAGICARSLFACGVRSGDVLHNAYGYGLFTGGMGVHYGAEKLGALVVPASGGKTAQQITLLKDLQARVLCATPSYALNLSYVLEEMGFQASDLGLKIGIFGAEPWTEPLRRQLEARLRIKAYDIYGTSELMGPGVAIECTEKQGLHIWEDHFLVEVINPATGEACADGEEGELVITTLTKEAYPFLRFRTGDLTAINRQPCKCGRTMLRMTRVRARLDDMLIIRGVNVYPSEIENILLAIEELAPHYQLVLRRDKALDELLVQVEVTEDLSSRWQQQRNETVWLEMLANRIKQLLKDNLGLTAHVELLPARSIQRSEGKACRLLDQRQAEGI